ncbi:NUDIX domain-containing protein [Nocardiopsis sp. CNT-189]|uniref:NUDIX domain-containing protein n=1 Tax=Nocardiopsis oceanisediminis TaxID=2816862 RepID=UPI003B30891E
MDLQSLVDDAERDRIAKLVVGAVVHDRGRVLILRRSLSDDFLPGIEELPSGGVEAGESLMEALARELAEEVGWSGPVEPDAGFTASFDYVSGSGRPARQYTFGLAWNGSPVVLSGEHTGHRWIAPGELGATDLSPESRQTIREWAAHTAASGV